MPMHDAPFTAAVFKNRCAQSCTINVTSFPRLTYIGGDGVLESGPRRLAVKMNLHVAKPVLSILHFPHFGKQMMIAIVCPPVVCMAALEHCQRLIVDPNFRRFGGIVLFKARCASHQNVANCLFVIANGRSLCKSESNCEDHRN